MQPTNINMWRPTWIGCWDSGDLGQLKNLSWCCFPKARLTLLCSWQKIGDDTFAGHQQRQVSWCWCCPPADGGAGASWRCHETEGGCRWWLELQAAEPPGEPQPSYLFFDLHFSDSANNTFRQKVNCLELGILNTSWYSHSLADSVFCLHHICILQKQWRAMLVCGDHLHAEKKININPEKCLLTLNAVQTLRIV